MTSPSEENVGFHTKDIAQFIGQYQFGADGKAVAPTSS
jgi:hypothetical protein